MEKKHYVCITCPRSCRLTVWEEADGIHVEGATCKRGETHGKNEYTNPMRMLTTTVAIEGGVHPRIAVVSSAELPKELLPQCLERLYTITLTAPVRRGQIIAADICGTGVDIIASRSMKTL